MKAYHLLLPVVVAVALSGCAQTPPVGDPVDSPPPVASPEPSPEPTRPAIDELVLGPDGFDQMRIGETPDSDPALAMVTFDHDACDGWGSSTVHSSYLISDGSDVWGRPAPFPAFTISDREGAIAAIGVSSREIPTDRGIVLGDSRSAVEAAYPDAVLHDEHPYQDAFIISGAVGELHIDVAKDNPDGYWADGAPPVDTVFGIWAAEPGAALSLLGTEGISGGYGYCSP